ncbi:MAG: hypothetical protein COR54_13920 [Elusimicrobia bacterium CG22_combo_CG10-13_8_21_14_all_63_91]|nr:MAG: hypothetical protein COR54_13920 [Elusimicrobia bacterium CG22_combo_CG10-13_8_21_14_all_63_91]
MPLHEQPERPAMLIGEALIRVRLGGPRYDATRRFISHPVENDLQPMQRPVRIGFLLGLVEHAAQRRAQRRLQLLFRLFQFPKRGRALLESFILLESFVVVERSPTQKQRPALRFQMGFAFRHPPDPGSSDHFLSRAAQKPTPSFKGNGRPLFGRHAAPVQRPALRLLKRLPLPERRSHPVPKWMQRRVRIDPGQHLSRGVRLRHVGTGEQCQTQRIGVVVGFEDEAKIVEPGGFLEQVAMALRRVRAKPVLSPVVL